MASLDNVADFELIREQQRGWASFVADLGFRDYISPEDNFSSELLTRAAWTSADECGIYCWVTTEGEAYVGQAVNVRNRLRQHWKVHRTLACAAFQPVARDRLDEAERWLVAAVEARYPILNIKLARSSAAWTPLDEIVPPDDVQRFVHDTRSMELGPWREWPQLVRKQASRFRTLSPEQNTDILAALKIYVSRCLPDPAATEVLFWSVSLRPQAGLELRVNVGQQETFTIARSAESNLTRVLAPKPLRTLFRSYPVEGPEYATNSYIHWITPATLGRFLTGQRLLECRKLVVYLMRHTTSLNSGTHCPQLVRAAFA